MFPTDEGTVTAARFVLVEPVLQSSLDALIDVLLAGQGGGTRGYARVAKRMEVKYGSRTHLKAMLEDISHGGLSMTVTESLALSSSAP